MPFGLLYFFMLLINNLDSHNAMIKKIKILFNYCLFFILLFWANLQAWAVVLKPDATKDMKSQNDYFNTSAGYENVDQYGLANLIGMVIQAFLSLLGIIFIGLFIYGGYTWMMARGNEEKVQKAKDTLMRAVIGLVISIAAYAIATFVIIRLKRG